MRFASALLALTALLASPAALAQPDDERLPDLTPSVFEIQGELEIDLPQLERQPLSGFGPPPRTYVVPAERPPATQPYGPGFEGLPALALAPPPDPSADLPSGATLRAEAGLGIAAARYARLDAGGPAGRAFLFFSGAYDGVGSTVLFGDEVQALDAEVRFGRLDLRGGVRSTGAVRAGLEARYARDAYSLPGTTLGVGLFEPERTVGHAALAGTLNVDGVTPAALRLSVARTSFETDVDGDPLAAEPEFRADAEGHVEAFRRLVRLEGATGLSSFIEGSDEADLVDYEAGVVLQAHRPGGASFALGARVLGYQTSPANGNDVSTTVFAPVVRVEVPLGLSARLFASTEPSVAQRSFAAFFAENPYAAPSPLVPDVHTVDARGGVEVRAGLVGFRAYAGAVYSPTRLFFVREGARGLYRPDYAKSRVFEGGADVTVASDAGVEASAGIAFRDGALTEFDEAIPFFASTVGRAGLQVPFARGRGRLGLAAYGEGARPTTRAAEGRPLVPGWATLSVYGTYEIGGGLGVVVRGERLLGDAERWPGYPQEPYTVMVGARLLR